VFSVQWQPSYVIWVVTPCKLAKSAVVIIQMNLGLRSLKTGLTELGRG
jgi:hypothetical protein